MGTVSKILSGTGILIAVYLLVANFKGTTSIIDSLGGAYTKGVQTLQGR